MEDEKQQRPTTGRRVKAFKGLFVRPTVRQFLHKGILYREEEERAPSRYELFFDLLYVGIIRRFAHIAEVGGFNAVNFAAFIVLFYASWAVWQETRNFVNICGTDDILQRLQILLIMGLLIGYTVNASSIHTIIPEIESQGVTNEVRLDTLQGAMAFFIVARAVRLASSLTYIIALPKFRRSFFGYALLQIVSIGIYLPLVFTMNQAAFWVLMTAGMVFELFVRYAVGLFPMPEYAPTINHEHFLERVNQIVILAVGEIILNLFYDAAVGDNSIGLVDQYWKALLGLIISFNIAYIFFDSDNSSKFIHAIRRNHVTALTVTNMYFPLIASIILIGASLIALITERDLVGSGAKWYFGGGIAGAVLSLAIIGALHKSLDRKGSALIDPHYVHGTRVVVAAVCAVLPLSDALDTPLKLEGLYAGILSALVCFEVLASLGAEAEHPDRLHPSLIPDGHGPEVSGNTHEMSAQDRLNLILTAAERGEENAGGESSLGNYIAHPATKQGALAAARAA